MAKLTAAERDRLAKDPRNFACPPLGYPIFDPAHVASARTYYRRPKTYKCPGGKRKICAKARQFGMTKPGYPGGRAWRSWCGGKA